MKNNQTPNEKEKQGIKNATKNNNQSHHIRFSS